MKALSMYVWSLLVIMMMGLTSCGDDDELQFSEEQLAYINKNKEYIWEKKTEKDEMGELSNRAKSYKDKSQIKPNVPLV